MTESDPIVLAEADAERALDPEIAPYVELVHSLMEVAHEALDTLTGTHVGKLGAVHACALLLTRLLNEAHACLHLVRRGYVMQGIALTAGMLEFTYAIGFIGADEARARRWVEHDDAKNSYPPIRQSIEATARAMGAPEEDITREYEDIYRDMCMAKHGNPMVLSQLGVQFIEGTMHVRVGPHVSNEVVRAARSAIGNVVRFVGLGIILFLIHHVDDPLAEKLATRVRDVYEGRAALIRTDKLRFNDVPATRPN